LKTQSKELCLLQKTASSLFRQRNTSPILTASFSNDGTEIPYTAIGVVFGSELLYNRIEVTPLDLCTPK